MKETKGRNEHRIVLGRSELQWASEEGLEIPRDVLESSDSIIIEIGPQLRFETRGGLGLIVDESYNERANNDR